MEVNEGEGSGVGSSERKRRGLAFRKGKGVHVRVIAGKGGNYSTYRYTTTVLFWFFYRAAAAAAGTVWSPRRRFIMPDTFSKHDQKLGVELMRR